MRTIESELNPEILLWRAQYAVELMRITQCDYHCGWQSSEAALELTEHYDLADCLPEDYAWEEALARD